MRKDPKKLMKNFIENICEKIGPRPPCSEQESKAAEFTKKEFKKYSKDVEIEKFTCHPGAYRAAFRWPLICYLIAVGLYWFVPIASLLVLIFAVIVFVGNNMYNREVIDWIFPEKKSTNVICKFKPKNKAKNLVIINAHHDANWEFPLLKKYASGPSYFMGVHFAFTALLALVLIIKLFLAFPLVADSILIVVFAAVIPLELYTCVNIVSNRPVQGANDNLSAVAVCLGVADYLSNPKNLPDNTEVWLCSFGCEEIGARGAKRFVSKHYNEVKDASVISLDIVGGKDEQLHILTKEAMVVSKSSEEMVKSLEKFADDLSIKVGKGPMMFFTNSMAFAMKGIKTVSVSSTHNGGLPLHYHTLEDTPDKLDYGLIEDCLKICLEFIKRTDKSAV